MVYDWPQHKDVLYNFYIVERRSLEDIMQHMRDVFNFTPSKRAYQTQFKRWGFPSKQNPAHRNLDLVERVRQLWEANYSQRDMLKTLNDEGYQLKERELMRLRAKNRWLLRIPNGMKPSDFADPNGDESDLNAFQNDLVDAAADLPVESPQPPASTADETSDLSEILRKRKERHDQMKAESDERYAAKKRRRRTREYAGIPADPPGPPRFPSETTLEESKAILGLDIRRYRELRDQFQTICEEEQVIKKTLAGNEKWSHVKGRLIQENGHLQELYLEATDPAVRASKDLALDVIATDVTKRMRGIGRRMTIVEAKNALRLNPEQSRQVRNSFYNSLQKDGFSSKLETGADHWEELKKQWLTRTPLLREVFKDGEADPEYEQKQKALEALCRDVMKRLRDDQSKRKKNPKKESSSTPNARTQSARIASAPTGPIDPSLLEAAGNFPDPIPTPVAVYIRPHANSQIHKEDKVWLASVTSSSMQELHSLLATKWPDAAFAQIEAAAKDANGQEMFYVLDSDDELEAYFEHVRGSKAVLVVLLNKQETSSRTGVSIMSFSSIPILDLSLDSSPATKAELLSQLRHALLEVGFLYIKNTGIPDELVARVISLGKAFFQLPEEEKLKCEMKNAKSFLGYNKLGMEITRFQTDWREQIDLSTPHPIPGPDEPLYRNLLAPNLWPDEEALPGFRAVFEEYMRLMGDMSMRFTRLCAEAIGLEVDAFDRFFDSSQQHKLKIVNMLTSYLLQASHHRGLQVQNAEGAWVDCPPIDGTFVVAIGQGMEALTQGVCQSTTHRVLSPARGSGARYSIPFFQGVSYDATFESMDVPEKVKALRQEILQRRGEKLDDIEFTFIKGTWSRLGEATLMNRIKSHPDVGERWYPELLKQIREQQAREGVQNVTPAAETAPTPAVQPQVVSAH
ncbi:hypothetical protein DV735_g5340, partial [Chaetothyriales sp. CBS 134920]